MMQTRARTGPWQPKIHLPRLCEQALRSWQLRWPMPTLVRGEWQPLSPMQPAPPPKGGPSALITRWTQYGLHTGTSGCLASLKSRAGASSSFSAWAFERAPNLASVVLEWGKGGGALRSAFAFASRLGSGALSAALEFRNMILGLGRR